MKKIILFALAIFFAAFVQARTPNQPVKTETKFSAIGTFANSKLTYKIIDAPDKTFGYDVTMAS